MNAKISLGILLLVVGAVLKDALWKKDERGPPVKSSSSNNNNNNNIEDVVQKQTYTSQSRCTWVFADYKSSPWEAMWRENIEQWQGNDGPYNDTDWWKAPGAGCEQMLKDKEKVDKFEAERVKNLQDPNSPFTPDLFSTFTYKNSCKETDVKTVAIEPLVSFLRHPRAVCFDNLNSPYKRMKLCRRKKSNCLLLSKDYLVFPRGQEMKTGKSIFFDIGASFYDTGFGGASQKWFVEHFAFLGWKFDRILAWEAIVNKEPSSYWNRVPKEVKPIITYYNIPVQADPKSPDNPWYYVKQLCTPADYCMVKLDIDTPLVEEALIKQLLEDTSLHPLLDDLVWEHHVRRNPLTTPGGWDLENAQATTSTTASSYGIFYKLRTLGIRAHSWV
eukprot:TRINITY_DN9310_c0_g3_i2.p1 TRINITY_DN9310_c0_g3~~TRINITY_DN9310_c0_g3_i2.p1  ORF type:complete len:387 (+),score=74.95 TRINITY_DN9310_c0_g3_i2:64-1224(+)